MIIRTDTTPQFRETAEKLVIERKAKRRARWLTITVIVAAVVALAMFSVGWIYVTGRQDGADSKIGDNATGLSQAQADITAMRQDLKTVCRQADTAKLPTSEQDKCFRAEANLPPQSVPVSSVPVAGPPGATPTDDQLLTLIRGVLAANPPRDGHTPTATELLDLIRPLIPAPVAGKDGVNPTDSQLLLLIQQVYAANPPAAGPKGDTGDKGERGEAGGKGDEGEPGRGVVYHEYVVVDGACQDHTVYTRAPTDEYDPVNPLLCAG